VIRPTTRKTVSIRTAGVIKYPDGFKLTSMCTYMRACTCTCTYTHTHKIGTVYDGCAGYAGI